MFSVHAMVEAGMCACLPRFSDIMQYAALCSGLPGTACFLVTGMFSKHGCACSLIC